MNDYHYRHYQRCSCLDQNTTCCNPHHCSPREYQLERNTTTVETIRTFPSLSDEYQRVAIAYFKRWQHMTEL